MIIDKNYERLRRMQNEDYVIDEIITDEDLVIDLDDRLIVEKSIIAKSIESNTCIKAEEYIEAEEYIKAGGYIKAEDGIIAMLHIKSKNYISAGKRIFAGICAWGNVDEDDMTIECTELKNGEICFGKLKIIKQVKWITIEEAEKELSEKDNCEIKIERR